MDNQAPREEKGLGKLINSAKEKAGAVKTRVQEMPKKHKIIGAVILLAVLIVIALLVTIALNANKDVYVPLYSTEMSTSEASEIYVQLQKMGADAKMGTEGQILVRQTEYDLWLLRLAAEGYPQTALSYDIFSSHTSMTSTEAESQAWLLKELQDRIQSTLKRLDGVNGATVTITVPETSDYVWQQANDTEVAKASVLLTLSSGVTLTPEQVSGIKNLVAFAVPKMEAENVAVVNASTSQELQGALTDEDGVISTQNMELEQQVQKQIEDNVKRLLATRYGEAGVVAVAKVTLNYDAMMTESMTPTTKPDGSGYNSQFSEDYSVNGRQTAGGIVGEENNTDTPNYAYTNPDNDGGMTDYHRDIDIDYGYIKTQIEKGQAILERATISVMVDETNLDAARSAELISLISMAADIDPQYIALSAMSPAALDNQEDNQTDITTTSPPTWIFIALGVVVLLLILIIILLMLRSKKRREEEEAQAAEEAQRLSTTSTMQDAMESEIDEYKRTLTETAMAENNAKEDALVDEIRDFAKQNPEITANLIRAWLKEDE